MPAGVTGDRAKTRSIAATGSCKASLCQLPYNHHFRVWPTYTDAERGQIGQDVGNFEHGRIVSQVYQKVKITMFVVWYGFKKVHSAVDNS